MNPLQSTICTGTLAYIPFILLAYATVQIYMPQCMYVFHCTATAAYIETPHYCTYNETKQTATFIYYAIASYVPTTTMTLKCHIYATYANKSMYRYHTKLCQCIHIYIYIYIYIYICHRHETGFGKETTRFRISVTFGLFGMDAGRCADELWQFFCTCAVVFLLN